MKLRIMSDLHLEFMRDDEEFDIPALPEDKDSVLILAGDIHDAKHLHRVFARFNERFAGIVFVYGNHEFYRTNMPAIPLKVEEAIAHLPNVWVLDTETVEINGVHFVGSTLWTDMDNLNQMTMWDAGQMMSDYRHIRTGPSHEPWKRKLRPVDTTSFHITQRNYMFKTITELKEAGETVVAVSHHLPSFQSIGPGYRGSSLNGAYASELWEQVDDAKPDLWIHGHTHDSMDYMLTDHTRVICNPRGYWPDDMNHEFNINLQVDV